MEYSSKINGIKYSVVSGLDMDRMSDLLEILQKSLKPFGVYVTDSPMDEGSGDYIGFIFSDEPLTKSDLKEIEKDYWQ